MKKNLKIYLVPHTHWDKEWYFIKDVSDVYLVDNMKNILNSHKANKDEAQFCWDGQYSIIDDYLKFFPDQKSKLKKLVEQKKLIIGPWYTQPDTFNTLGESIVRNLLVGTKLAQELGHSMQVAYLPDTFGFNSNLPQIISKTNNLGIINWRGADDELVKHNLFNLWEADDGTKYPTYNLFRHGYYTGVGGLLKQYHKNWSKDDEVNWDPDQFASKHAQVYLDWVKSEVEILEARAASTNNRILIPIGSDQMPMVKGWKKVIAAMNEIDPENEYILSDFESFFADLVNDPEVMQKAQTIKGQFRYGKYARAHKTITSSRYDIKKLSREVENLIYKELEPLAVMYKEFKGEYPSEIILEATKLLVSCHAHDSLGGCNTDETNRAIIARLESAQGLVEGQITLIKKRIMEKMKLNQNDILLFNLEPYAFEKEFCIKVNTRKQSFALKENQQNINFGISKQLFFDNDNFKIVDSSTDFINKEQKVYSNLAEKDLNATNFLLEEATGRFQTTVNFKLAMPGFGYKVISLTELEQPTNIVNQKETYIENEFFKIWVEANEIKLFDKKRNQTYSNFLELEAHIDAGDTYDFSPPKEHQEKINQLTDLKILTQVHNNIKVMNLNLVYNFSDITYNEINYQTKSQAINLHIVLNQEKIDYNLEIANQVENIRWRIIFNSEIKNQSNSFADQAYAIVARKINDEHTKTALSEKWVDYPIEIEACESLVYLTDNKTAFGVFTKGTNEYQIIGANQEKIAITLFRGVSRIGNRDLLYRGGRASGINDYPHPTPESNLLKKLEFSLSTYVSEDIFKLNVLSKLNATPSVYYQKQTINQFQWKGDTFVQSQNSLKIKKLPNEISFANILALKNLVVTTIKQTWDKKNNLIRFYNPTSKVLKIESNALGAELNLLEEVQSNSIYEINPNEVKTFVLKLTHEKKSS
ncbi:glycosyl hydrolase, family 38 [Spiroplasma clarkii]|uniref:Glycosyl hydrolase n=1 Tax=Spiroplasma clarkii TaxID=2139 RepID=A0A1Y0KZW4_9MOLU|nr:glycoside hydrolase family 38 C-terminal domain-containing protein [Spiroplasma clarkii]ARU91045.1 glycosyl hydrolase, family 38 [Spiroplasma clarkii]ATX70481.1 glycosyl hydrolase [Spiroplasma clarkii]